MQMTGEQVIAAPREKVWEALNDPAVLARCIPGCQSLDKEGDDRFVAVAEIRIGPIGARFRGNVQLSDCDAPNGYTITGSGNGGIAGSARGGAKVRLSDAGPRETRVSYEVEAEVGGRMAQLGGPIIDATAKNLAGTFFSRFGEVVEGRAPAASAVAGEVPATPASAQLAPQAGLPQGRAGVWGWILVLVLALVTGFSLGRMEVAGLGLLMVAILLVVAVAAGFEAGRRGGGR
ncbi:hypothetical protein GCM10011494_06500 [Novosphingobium endophyticum]|uniref:Carbon monoxide dehydrogenase n=1 Tax=Novosphingobium endophyticum TaxID=1955250 RepID=A0A916TPY1_9SPHN|nr:carbon monoxide dehydrogenase subunit G [Novosphingobium endophyticum]GGB90833.1 hypothetical protein GCM10011494_06500 [Novosphingobium endophyticum]